MKHIEETLSKYPKVRKIINPKTVIYICDKQIRLNKNYDPDLLEHHVKIQDPKTLLKRKVCIGLNDEKVKLYLCHIGLITIFGGAPSLETIAQELFGDKIKSSFHWKDLKQEENNRLINALQSQAKWINDSTMFCVRSTDCLIYVDGINEV
ncbi:4173_t:CDS:2, partial [Dentiscutata erythropus]